MKYLAPALLLTAALLTACGGDKSGNSGNDSGNNPGNTSPDVTTRLTSCGVGSSMNGCLAGSYSGKTLSGEACTVTIKADGGYTFAAPKLNYTYATTAQTVQTYSHSISSGQHTLNWSETDPSGTRLQLSSTFGTGVAAPLADLTGTSGGQSETCRVGLTATSTPGGGTGEVSTLTRLSGQVYDTQDFANPDGSSNWKAVPWAGGAQTLALKVYLGQSQEKVVATGTIGANGQFSIDLPTTLTAPLLPAARQTDANCTSTMKSSNPNSKGVAAVITTADNRNLSAIDDSVSLSSIVANGVPKWVGLNYTDSATTVTGDLICTIALGNGKSATSVSHHNLALKKGWNLILQLPASGSSSPSHTEINFTTISNVPQHWISGLK